MRYVPLRKSSLTMEMVFCLYVIAVLVFNQSLGVFSAIGPIADLHIVNGNVDPDGYAQPAVLADGMCPGPLICGATDGFRSLLLSQSYRLRLISIFCSPNFVFTIDN
ncbi:hypothetical protein AcW1_006507 [Taiwanofungus camphoratus]|nr:hypothetical protein AcV7_003069 [Antrodia cinnamomea]KAI0954706.1 hypothetical protein AcW1_006507 [Antrodia cinnamomea]